MAAYLSNLLTQTTTKYNSIKRTLLPNENDGDSEADSHISRVLIAYYNDKPEGSEWPSFLPIEARRAPQQGGGGAIGAVGAGYAAIWGGGGGQQQQQQQQQNRAVSPQMGYGSNGSAAGGSMFNARPGALDDLWDSGPRPSSSRTLPGQTSSPGTGSAYGPGQGGGGAYGGGGYSRPGMGASPPGSSHTMGGAGTGLSGMSASERLKAKYRR